VARLYENGITDFACQKPLEQMPNALMISFDCAPQKARRSAREALRGARPERNAV
jgi:hypothetical protein